WRKGISLAFTGKNTKAIAGAYPCCCQWDQERVSDMITLVERADGIILPVRAQPGARKAGIIGEQAGALKVAVTAPPEDGKANKALLEVLREALSLKRSQIELIGGETSRDKRFLVRGVPIVELTRRISAIATS